MFTLVPGLVCTWLVDVPSAHAPRRNEYRRLQTAIQTYDPVYNNWVERSGPDKIDLASPLYSEQYPLQLGY